MTNIPSRPYNLSDLKYCINADNILPKKIIHIQHLLKNNTLIDIGNENEDTINALTVLFAKHYIVTEMTTFLQYPINWLLFYDTCLTWNSGIFPLNLRVFGAAPLSIRRILLEGLSAARYEEYFDLYLKLVDHISHDDFVKYNHFSLDISYDPTKILDVFDKLEERSKDYLARLYISRQSSPVVAVLKDYILSKNYKFEWIGLYWCQRLYEIFGNSITYFNEHTHIDGLQTLEFLLEKQLITLDELVHRTGTLKGNYDDIIKRLQSFLCNNIPLLPIISALIPYVEFTENHYYFVIKAIIKLQDLELLYRFMENKKFNSAKLFNYVTLEPTEFNIGIAKVMREFVSFSDKSLDNKRIKQDIAYDYTFTPLKSAYSCSVSKETSDKKDNIRYLLANRG